VKTKVVVTPAAPTKLASCCKEALRASRDVNKGTLFFRYVAHLADGRKDRSGYRHAYELIRIEERYDGLKALMRKVCQTGLVLMPPYLDLDSLVGEARACGKEQELWAILALMALRGRP